MKLHETEEITQPHGWWLNCEGGLDGVEAGVDESAGRSQKACAYLKSANDNLTPKLTKNLSAAQYHGNRIKMSGWVKTKSVKHAAQLWLRVDIGDNWQSDVIESGSFDNMDDRPITSTSEWTLYELVVDVSEQSTAITFGLLLRGEGQVWLGDFSFDVVNKDIPLTGKYVLGSGCS